MFGMRILMVNKFLHPNGGSETYIFQLGAYLQTLGHEIQYFGMEHERRIVGNRVDAYTSNMDFHTGSKFAKLLYPVKTIYSFEARKKIRMVLDDFQPDICHLNNFNYQLTPSIILEIRKWEKATGHSCKILYTAHDYQLICPNHMCHQPATHTNCEQCLKGQFLNCAKNKCIHGSLLKSIVGSMEAYFWKWQGVYRHIDAIICCSEFMKSKLNANPLFATKTLAYHNFVARPSSEAVTKKNYVLFFGRYAQEKGIATLVQAASELPDIPFIFAGSGPLEHLIDGIPNIKNVGFQTGKALESLIREARFSVYPSEWYENCPFSIMESIMYGTPVLGADIGGIPELIEVDRTGDLFRSGDNEHLKEKLQQMWNKADRFHLEASFPTVERYYHDVLAQYITTDHSIAKEHPTCRRNSMAP